MPFFSLVDCFVRRRVGWSVGQAKIPKPGGKLHFHAPIGPVDKVITNTHLPCFNSFLLRRTYLGLGSKELLNFEHFLLSVVFNRKVNNWVPNKNGRTKLCIYFYHYGCFRYILVYLSLAYSLPFSLKFQIKDLT